MEKTTAPSFGKHSSKKLQQVFSKKPYQIQKPEDAEIIFLGIDANWAKDIKEEQPLFLKETIDYLEDGVKYWKDNGVHTPMLKDIYEWDGERYFKNTYKGDGKKYHTQFRKLGFLPKDAEKICFLELLSICTYGRSRASNVNEDIFDDMLNSAKNKKHLERIRKIFKLENIICIPESVEKIINRLGGFNIHRKNIIHHPHFSSKVFSDKDLHDLRDKLWTYLRKK